jgi:conjugation transfer TcpE-like protein
VELPTYTNIWKIEKRLYKLYDFRLPMPLPVGQIAAFLAIAVPYMLILTMAGMPFSHTWLWVYVLPPGVLAWLVTRPVLEGKRLPELVLSQLRYLGEPKTWCRMTPLAEKDMMFVFARAWRSAAYARPPAAEYAQFPAAELPSLAVPTTAAVPTAAVPTAAVPTAAVPKAAVPKAAVPMAAVATAQVATAAAATAERIAPTAARTQQEPEPPARAKPEWPQPAVLRLVRERSAGRPPAVSPPAPAPPAPPAPAVPAVPPAPARSAQAAPPAPAPATSATSAAQAEPAPPAAGQKPVWPNAPASSRPVAPFVQVSEEAGPVRALNVVERALRSHDSRSRREPVVVVPGGHRPGKPDQLQRDQGRARLPLPAPARVVLLGCTAGAGQTTVTLLAGQLLASLRGEPVAVVDLGGGSLTERARSIPVLLPSQRAGAEPGSHKPGLQVVTAAESAPDAGQVIDSVVARYRLTLADPAAGCVPKSLRAADQLVLVAPASADAAHSLAMTLEWLEAHDYGRLAEAAITVLNGVSGPTTQYASKAAAVVSGRCRAIVQIPWDERLRGQAGQPLGTATVLAYTALAGVLVAALADAAARSVVR